MMESSFAHTFLFGFPNQTSDILIHLTHWQYWFWFWFTYFLVLYYFLFLRLIRFRNVKFSPKLNTSFRSHGKWGDFIVCLVPISWCTNILSNSNFILRMIEWQSESTLFTLRIRGKQWYWVYKFELKVFSDILNTPKNIGNNFWTLSSYKNSDNFLFFLKQKHDLSFNNLIWSQSIQQDFKTSNSNSFSSYMNFNSTKAHKNNLFLQINTLLNNNKSIAPNLFYTNMSYILKNNVLEVNNNYSFTNLQSQINSTNTINSYNPVIITRSNKLTNNLPNNLRLYLSNNNDSLVCKFNNTIFQKKPFTNNLFLVIKQKRFSTPSYNSSKNIINKVNLTFFKNNLKQLNIYLNENRSYDFNNTVSSNKRLLRTRRILVLPTSVNIGLITNSFDVMHSWYIPGLGIKLDCVPGRSTHHIIHIDHAGFYYGQCAEICGRYHHHMPIRVCALPYEHFLLWWYNYGSPFFLAANQDRSKFLINSSKQLNW